MISYRMIRNRLRCDHITSTKSRRAAYGFHWHVHLRQTIVLKRKCINSCIMWKYIHSNETPHVEINMYNFDRESLCNSWLM
jgi:hypothetical protein